MAVIARKVAVRGRVQGVGFRYATREAASAEGVHGWVRNLQDGSVEAVLEGEEQAVGSLLEWLRHGPSTARVDALDVQEIEPRELGGFTVR